MAAAALSAAYFAAIAIVLAATRFDGGVAFLWIATALLTARLVTQPRRAWPLSLALCAGASALATSLFGLGLAVAVPLALVNVGEAMVGALMLRRTVGKRAVLDSHGWLIGFVIASGMVAPLAGAIAGPGIVWLLLGKPFVVNALHWYSGHALGTLAFMPIAMMVLRGEARRLIRAAGRDRLIEMTLLLTLVVGTTVVTFAQDRLPLLFLPLLPVILATFRGGALSTAASIVIISIVGGAFTLAGHGPVALTIGGVGDQMQFLQFYIAATMLTVLPANAELERRAELFRQLRESEARYRLVTESSTDIVLNTDVRGTLRFVSASARQFGGQDPAALIGQAVTALLDPADAPRALAAIAAVAAAPGRVTLDEYRVPVARGEERWFETHSRAVLDDAGLVTGVVIALRDVTHRKAREERLARTAMTDPLTALPNRRGFEEELAVRLSANARGCIAMFDLDHFKRVNDSFGHAAGDAVLRRFAAIARTSVRDQDFIARLGGEEFAAILPDATIEQARLVCDRLRVAVASERFAIPGGTIAITVSGGVAPYAAGSDDGADVLRAADAALYRAKRAGRDQLSLVA